MTKIGFLGCGKIGRALLHEIKETNDGEVVFVQDPLAEEAEIASVFPRARVIREADPDAFAAVDLVIECATANALKENLELILTHSSLLMFSVTAFSDPDFEEKARRLGQEFKRHIYIPHGAILGLDGILDGRTAWDSVTIETTKNPASLGRTESERTVLYEGCTREACALFPRNVNVHAAVALAGIGFERTMSRIIADPAVHTNSHVISLRGKGVDMQIRVSSFSEGGVTGKYTPLSACGSLRRILDSSEVIKIV